MEGSSEGCPGEEEEAVALTRAAGAACAHLSVGTWCCVAANRRSRLWKPWSIRRTSLGREAMME